MPWLVGGNKNQKIVDYEFTRGKLEPWYHVMKFLKKEKFQRKTSTSICLLLDCVTLAIKQGQQTKTVVEAVTK